MSFTGKTWRKRRERRTGKTRRGGKCVGSGVLDSDWSDCVNSFFSVKCDLMYSVQDTEVLKFCCLNTVCFIIFILTRTGS